MKKILTLFTALILFGSVTVKADDVYIVAGNNSTIFGAEWKGDKTENKMEWEAARSLFVKTFTVAEAINGVELKVVKNNSDWIGDPLGNNVKFDLNGAGSFRVLFNTETGVASVEGAIVVPKSMYSVFAVGNGSGSESWLNGKYWDTGAAANKMTEVEPNVWEIAFSNVSAANGRELKFAVNGSWDVNFGGTFSAFDVATEAAHNSSSNITFNSPGGTNIAARLDLRNCKSNDKSGGKFTVSSGPLPELHSCYVAGSSAEIFGAAWTSGSDANKMTLAGTTYSKTFTVTKAYKSVSLKAVYDGAWFGDNGENVKFSLSGAGTFTVTFDNFTHEVAVTGSIVGPEQFDFEYAAVAANGEGNWAHGEDWNAATTSNRMTEVATNVWEISFENVPAKYCQFKFCFDGTWTHEFGGTFSAFGAESSAIYGNSASSISFNATAGSTITIRLDMSGFNFATKEGATFTVTQVEPIAPIAPIGGKFTINAKGDTAIFARGNLQYQQSSNTWRCAPNQYEWKGTDNLQMGNSAYEGWVDLFCWSIGAENNYGATSAYLTTTYFNKSFVDWGGLFSDTYEWSTLSINEWYYLLYSRANANNLWGMAMIGDNLGMIILPDEWTAPSGVTFVPGTIPTTDLFAEGDCLDPTMADQDHWRLNPDNLPANKFTVADWEILEAAGAVFLPYGGRRSGGYGNHTNRQDQTIAEEYAYAYYENYYGSYWTSTVAKPAEGKSYWLPLICGGCNDANENWGRGSHGWWENGRYGHSVRLVTRIPKVEWTEVRTGLTAGNYYTLCNAKAMTAIKGGTLWSFAGKDEQLAYIVQEDAPFTAGKPYLIYAESDKLEALLEEGSDAPASDYNGLFGTLANMDNAALLAAGATHLLKNNELHPVGAGTLRAGRAYIKAGELPNGKPSNAPAHKVRSMPMQRDAAQGIEDVQGDNVQSTKVLINGNLYILRGENVYDATGRVVK